MRVEQLDAFSPTELRLKTPPHSFGTKVISVVNPDGQEDVRHQGFTYDPLFDDPAFAVDPEGQLLTTLGQVKRTALLQNYPNPFNPETWIPYALADDADVTLRIYNLQGELIRTFERGKQATGLYLSREQAVYWDGQDNAGEPVASGVYFYQLIAGEFKQVRRMVVVK